MGIVSRKSCKILPTWASMFLSRTLESYECGCAEGYFDINNNGRVCEACCDEIEFYLHESLNRICKFSHDLNAHFLFKRTISAYVQVWNQIKAQRFKVENSFMIVQKQINRKIMVKDWNTVAKVFQVNWFHFSTNRVLLKAVVKKWADTKSDTKSKVKPPQRTFSTFWLSDILNP